MRDLSMKSGIKAPIIRANRLNLNLFLIYGISKIASGIAI